MLIDLSYFQGEINIPNTADSDASAELLNQFINKYEPEFLQKVFGYKFYKSFIQGTTTSPFTEPWNSLVSGAEYNSFSTNTLQKWKGLIDETTKQSPIANYVYYFYQRNAETQSTGIGETKTQPTGVIDSSAALKVTRAWNEMVDWIYELYDYMQSSQSIYPEYDSSYFSNAMISYFQKMNPFF